MISFINSNLFFKWSKIYFKICFDQLKLYKFSIFVITKLADETSRKQTVTKIQHIFILGVP